MARRPPEYGSWTEGEVETLDVGEHRGEPLTLRFYEDGTVRVRHLCDRRFGQRPDVAPHCVFQSPALVLGPYARAARGGRRHVLRRDDDGAVWIGGSIACPDCDLHVMVERSTARPA